MLHPTFPLVHPFLSHSHSHSHFVEVQCAVWYCNLHVEQLHRLHSPLGNIWGNISGPIKMVGLLSLVTCRTWMRSPQTAVCIADYTGAGPPHLWCCVHVVVSSRLSRFGFETTANELEGTGPNRKQEAALCFGGGGSRRAPSVHTNKVWVGIASPIASCFRPQLPPFVGMRSRQPKASNIGR